MHKPDRGAEWLACTELRAMMSVLKLKGAAWGDLGGDMSDVRFLNCKANCHGTAEAQIVGFR